MPDDLTKRRPQDARRINIHEPYELKFWSSHFGISQEMLVKLVKHHGDSAEEIRRVLKK